MRIRDTRVVADFGGNFRICRIWPLICAFAHKAGRPVSLPFRCLEVRRCCKSHGSGARRPPGCAT